MHGCSSWSSIRSRRQQVEADESGVSLQLRDAFPTRRQSSRASSNLFFKAILSKILSLPGKIRLRRAFRRPRYARPPATGDPHPGRTPPSPFRRRAHPEGSDCAHGTVHVRRRRFPRSRLHTAAALASCSIIRTAHCRLASLFTIRRLTVAMGREIVIVFRRARQVYSPQ